MEEHITNFHLTFAKPGSQPFGLAIIPENRGRVSHLNRGGFSKG